MSIYILPCMQATARAAALVVLVTTVVAFARDQAPTALSIERLDSPAGADTAQPQLAAYGDRVILSWVARSGSRASLQLAERTSAGWTEPRTAASGDSWFVNWADVPSVIPLADGTLAAHWLQKSANSTYAYDVRLSFSRDAGRSWTSSVTPHHDGTKTEHGFASLFQTPGAGLGLVWLDGRAMKSDSHDGHDVGSMSLRSAVFNPDGTQRSESLVDARVCECCPTAVVVTSDGPITAYRDRAENEIRDIYVSRFTDGKWTEGRAVHADNWTINACPVNGPALSARGRDVVIAWFTGTGDQGQAYVAFSTDAGRSFGAAIRVDDGGTLGRVDVELMMDGSAAVSWIELADQRAEFRLRRIDRSGVRSPARTISPVSRGRNSGYPRMAFRGEELLLAWTDIEGGLRVRTARARLGPGTRVAN